MSAKKALSSFFSIALLGLVLVSCSDSPDTAVNKGQPEERIVPPGLLAPDAEWQSLADGLVYTDGIAAEADGDAYFAEVFMNRIYKVTAEGEVSLFDESTAGTKGLAIGPDGLLYACRNLDAQIVRYSATGDIEVLLQGELSPVLDEKDNPGEFCNDIAINAEGEIWFTDRVNKRVIYLATDGSSRVVAEGFRPNGLQLLPDRQMLVVTDSNKAVLHAFRIEQNRELVELPDLFDPIRLPDLKPGQSLTPLGPKAPGSDGLEVDSEGRLYLTTFYGIQVFDREGRNLGVLPFPKGLYFISNIGFGGTDHQWLYASGRNGIVRIKMLVRGTGGEAAAPAGN